MNDCFGISKVMPYAGAYVSNCGYRAVLLAIEHQLPLLVAGVYEGKNEICARVSYSNLGINLKTLKPASTVVRKSVQEILNKVDFKKNVARLAKEFSRFRPAELTAQYVDELLADRKQEIEEDVREVFY